ncbi:MAG: helix-turn-helix domain-containing protein [Hyphomicrobiaceae bacterium]
MPKKTLRKPGKHLTKLLALNLRTLRKARGLSQEALAELCGLHRTYVGSVERGERNLTLSSLEMLGKALGVSVTDLLTPRDNDDTPAAN